MKHGLRPKNQWVEGSLLSKVKFEVCAVTGVFGDDETRRGGQEMPLR